MKKRVLALILAFSMVFTMLNGAFAAELPGAPRQSGDASHPTAYAAQASDFTDLPDDWSRGAIERAIENGLLSGTNGKINAGAQLTRAELAAIVVRAFGTTETASLSGFSDVNPSDWYYDALQKAVAMGILSGNNGKLNPNAPITREEVCAVLYRAFLLQDGGSAAQKFGDAGQISDWAQAAVAAMAAKGYIAGDSSGNVNGSKTITRAEFAQMMDNLVKGYPSGAQGGVIEGNAIMKAGQSLSGMTIKGDLILADGLGRNDVDLSDCTVEGRIIVRGGNEVKLSGATRTGGGVVAAASTAVNNNTGSKLSSVSVEGANVNVTLSGEIGRVDVKADNVTVNAAGNAKIDAVETSASGTTVAGSGEVAEVNVNPGASNTSVTTNHTDITVAQGAGTVSSNSGSLSAGQTGTTDNKGALQANGTNASHTSKPSKDSSSDSDTKRPSRPSRPSEDTPSDDTDRVAVTDESGRTIGSFARGTVLTVDLNNGSRTYTVTVGSGTTIQTPTREGYTFNGWSVSGTTVTAQWTKNGETPALIEVRDSEGRPIGAYMAGTQLTIDPANETDEPYTFTVGANNKTITVPTREGYHLNRWLPIGHTVTADWIKNTSVMTPVKRDDGVTIGNFEVGVTLTIDPNNGEEVYTVTVAPGLVIETPKKDGYNFVNWFRDPRTTITAQWSEVPVETGSVEGSEGRPIANYPIGTVLTVIPDNGVDEPYTVTVAKKTVIQRPTRDGYKFDRWEVTGTSIKALWTRKETVKTEVKCSDGHTVGNYEVGVTLTIDPANGKDAPYTVTVTEGLIIQHPTREGYTFKEWLRDPLTSLTATWTKNDEPIVTSAGMIYDGKKAAPIIIDAAYTNNSADAHAERTYNQIVRAVGDLRQDIAMVTGAIDFEDIQQIFDDDVTKQAARLAAANTNKVPQLMTDTSSATVDYAIIIGSIDDSEIIKKLIADKKLGEADGIKDKWEAFVIKEVENPTDNIKKALVIAGSDARGTIYGIYSISEEIGVSPWYWYSDVPVQVKNEIKVDYRNPLVDNGPDVKYRGIFINDEENSNKWAREKFTTDKNGTPGVNYYRRLFEVMLRMKANTLWPGMHECSTAFFKAKDTDGLSLNGKEASRYGIIMASSHCEILLRNNVGESWKGAYNFSTNEPNLLQYWRERLQEIKTLGVECIATIGIRGEHDGAFHRSDKDYQGNAYAGNTSAERDVSFMKDVITKQRALIKEVFGSEDGIQQVLIPYKEMGTVYNNGLDKFMEQYPDVIIMWANDNYGFIRQTPNETEAARPGGTGIYYHTSYMSWQCPKSWLFLNSLPIRQMNEQMHRAYDSGVQRYWLLNVGDLKPGDILAEYFMKLGWNIEDCKADGIHSYLADWAKRSYGLSESDAETAADVMEEFYQLTGTKRAEFFGTENDQLYSNRPYFSTDMINPFSVTAMGDEGQRLVDQCNEMVGTMTTLYNKMGQSEKDAFFEQMYFHVLAYRDIAEEYVYYWKNKAYAEQGRCQSAQLYADMSAQAVDRLWEHVYQYWNTNNGKWNKVIYPEQLYGGTTTNQGLSLITSSHYMSAAAGEGIGAFAEGNTNAGSGKLRFNSMAGNTHYIDVFSKSGSVESWTMTAPDWVKLSSSSGATAVEERITVDIDWTKVSGTANGQIVVNGNDNSPAATFDVVAVNKSGFNYGTQNGHVEANGYVMIEAEHFADNIAGTNGDKWSVVSGLGQRDDVMKASDNYPELGTNVTGAAKLVYNVYFENAGTYPLTYYRMPTLNEGKDSNGEKKACRTALYVNGQMAGDLLRGTSEAGGSNEKPGSSNYSWALNVMRLYEPLTREITVNQGWNTIEIYRSSPSVMFDRIMIVTEQGAVADSLVGPEESPNNIGTVKKHGIAEIPAYINNVLTSPDVTLSSNEQREVTLGNEITGTPVSAVSKNKAAAKVEVKGGKLIVTAGKVGESRITVTLNDGSVAMFNVRVNYAEPTVPQGGAYILKSGRNVINAVDALENSEYAKTTNGTGGNTWTRSGMGLQVSDTGKNWTSTDASSLLQNAPTISFKVKADGENYYLSVNTSNPDTSADSFHLILNGQYIYTYPQSGGVMDGKETWYNNDVGSGSIGALNNESAWKANDYNTITIVAREDGFFLNQIMLSTTKQDSPDGLQFAETQREQPQDGITLNNFENVILSENGTETVPVTAGTILGSADVTVNVASSDTNIATAEYSGSNITVTAVKAGTVKITVTASADGLESVSKTFTVTVNSADDESKMYLPNDSGDIVINAVDALQNKPYAKYSDYSATHSGTTFSWVAAEKSRSIQLTPVNPESGSTKNWTTGTIDALKDKVPSLSFKIYVEEAGDYYLNSFTNSPYGTTDSFHVVLNDQYQYASHNRISNGDQHGGAVGEGWFYHDKDDQTIHLQKGVNVLTIYGREAGVLIRQLMLSKSKKSKLTDWQTASNAAELTSTAAFSIRRNTVSLANLEDIGLFIGSTKNVLPKLTEESDVQYTVKAKSSDKDVVTVDLLEDGEITLTGIAVGEAEITVWLVTDDEDETELAKQTFTVTVAESKASDGDGKPSADNADSEQKDKTAQDSERLPEGTDGSED